MRVPFAVLQPRPASPPLRVCAVPGPSCLVSLAIAAKEVPSSPEGFQRTYLSTTSRGSCYTYNDGSSLGVPLALLEGAQAISEPRDVTGLSHSSCVSGSPVMGVMSSEQLRWSLVC